MSPEDVTFTKELGFHDIIAMPFDKEAAKAQIQKIIDHELSLTTTEKTLRKIEIYAPEQPGEALKLITENLFVEGPFKGRALLASALVHMNLGKLDKATFLVKESLKIDPASIPAIQLSAKLLCREGKYDEAITHLESLHKKSPKNLTTKVGLGAAYVGANREEDANRILREVTDIDSSNQDAKDQLSIVAFKKGDFKLAEQLIAETENGGDLARLFNNIAVSEVNKGFFDKGLETYRQAIRLLT
ncbi:MAG: tetratricopeptide repeat protein, partial [Proteobacteria bacterium]